MTAVLDEAALLGSQEPTHKLVPAYDYTLGDVALEVATIAGLELDPWQKDLLFDGLGVCVVPSPVHADDGKLVDLWAAREVFVELSRQNGKSVVFEARTLAGLYVFRERLIVYSAHKGETALAAFSRIEELIRNDAELLSEVRKFNRTNGKESIELVTGQLVKFRTRTAGGGRGLSGDCVIIDENQDTEDQHLAALYSTMSARPNPQLWYGGSAGTQKSTVQGRLVRRVDKGAPKLCGYRWAAAVDCDRGDPQVWARHNPAVGRRMTVDFIRSEQGALGYDEFGRERLGIGDYPRAEGEDWVIPRTRWEAALDPASTIVGPVVFSAEVKWDRSASAISVAGYRADGGRHLEVIARRPGTRWLVESLDHLLQTWPHFGPGLVLDPASPVNNLVPGLTDKGYEPWMLTTSDLQQAFGDLYDGIVTTEADSGFAAPPTYHHRGGTVLTTALAEALTRRSGGATTWQRAVPADVTGLLAATWAAHGLTLLGKPPAPPPKPRPIASSTGDGSRRTDIRTANF